MEGLELVNTVSSCIIVAIVAIGAIGCIVGFIKGTFKSLTDLLFVALNVILSILIATMIAKNVVTVDTLKEYFPMVATNLRLDQSIIDEVNGYITSPELNSTAIALLLAFVSVIVLPIMFMLVYLVLGVVLFIPKLLVNKIIMPSTKGIGLRLGGGLIGLATSVVSICVFMIPIVGYVNYASDTIDMLKNDSEQIEFVQNIEGVVDEAKDTPVFKAIHSVGGRKLFDTLTTITVDDVTISLTHETETAINIYKESGHFIYKENGQFVSVPLNEYGEEQVKSIERIEEIILDADFVPAFIANTLAYIAQQWNKGDTVFGIEKPIIGTELQEALDHTLLVLEGTTPDNFKKDLCTIAEVIKASIEDGVVRELTSENGNVLYVLENTNVISDILVELHRNERTRPILPAITNGVINYLYGIYDEVNGTTTEKHNMVDINGLTEEVVSNEGKIIANVIVEIDTFLKSIEDKLEGDVLELIRCGDFAALGRAFNGIKRSYLFCDTYEFLLRTVLESKGCADLGILDSQFIVNAIKHDSDMEMMLVSRQKITLLVLSMYHGEELDYNNAVEVLLSTISIADADSIKSIITEENLNSIGVRGEHAHTISGLLTSMVDTMKDDSIQIAPEDTAKEAESVGKIITAIDSALENEVKDKNVFASNEDKESTSSMTASEFVSTTLESKLVSSMVVIATKDENGNEVDDPYNIKEHLSENDVKELETVLGEEYSNMDENDESKKEKLDAIAHIFGIDVSNFNK